MKSKMLLFIIILSGLLNAQMQQKIQIKLDSLNAAHLEISMTMNASQWDAWVNTLGNNPAALKREIQRSMPGYFMDDFELEKDEMERSFTMKLKVDGICKIDKKGKWILDTDQKNAQMTELNSHQYMLVSSPPEFGGQMQQQYILQLPTGAKDIEVTKDSFGKSVFKFEMERSSGTSSKNMLRYGGIALLVLGGAWSLVQMRRKA